MATKSVRREAGFASDSTLLKVSMLIAMVAYLPKERNSMASVSYLREIWFGDPLVLGITPSTYLLGPARNDLKKM
jgi:hypothetical protein